MKNRSLPAEQEAAARQFVTDCLRREGFSSCSADGQPSSGFSGENLVVVTVDVRLVPAGQQPAHSFAARAQGGATPIVLTASPRALRRQHARPPMEDQTFGGMTLRHRLHQVEIDGVPVPLTLREYELLSYLCFHKNLVLTRAQIIGAVWDIGYQGDDRTVDTHIKCLRAKLGPYGHHIQTLRKIGYRFSWPGGE